MARGWYNMACWNGLSKEQQQMLIVEGNLPLGYVSVGECQRPASVCIECEDDQAPGPRFYCKPCAILYLEGKGWLPGLIGREASMIGNLAAQLEKEVRRNTLFRTTSVLEFDRIPNRGNYFEVLLEDGRVARVEVTLDRIVQIKLPEGTEQQW